jgi:hypothetical protein
MAHDCGREDMSEADVGGGVRGANDRASGNAAGVATSLLSLAAAPTFAVLALLAGFAGGGQPDTLCSAGEHMSALHGMIPMYVLMSAFHVPPWLKLISGRRNGARRGWSFDVR